jgi:hypothetical protein
LLTIEAKTCKNIYFEFEGQEFVGSVPPNTNIGNKDHLDITICLECGQTQGEFPKANPDFSQHVTLSIVKTGEAS